MLNNNKVTPVWNPKFDSVFERYEQMKKRCGGMLRKYNNS